MQAPWRICAIHSDEFDNIPVFEQAAKLHRLAFGTDRNAPDPLSKFRNLWYEHLGCSERVQAFLVALSRDQQTDELKVWGFASVHPLMRDLDPTLHDLLAFQSSMLFDVERTLLVSALVVDRDSQGTQVLKDLVAACKTYAHKNKYDHLLLWQPMVPPEMAVHASMCGLETYIAGRLLDDDLMIPPSAVVYWGATS